jgi:YihY family inner membrane protein
MTMSTGLDRLSRRAWNTLVDALNRFMRIDGAEWAGAFAHYAFFSLFPLIVLFVSIASLFIERDRAAADIIAFVGSYLPIEGEERSFIFSTVSGVIGARGQAGIIAMLMLGWSAMRFFSTLIRATNRAWGVDAHNWWRLPLTSLLFLVIMAAAVLVSIAAPILTQMIKESYFPTSDFRSWVYSLWGFFVPMLVVFIGLSLFYRMAPRRRTHFSEVWIAALCATALLKASEILFVIYLKYFVSLNAVYGAFGGIIALLLWIYLAGCIFIFGACLCAAQAETRIVREPVVLPL